MNEIFQKFSIEAAKFNWQVFACLLMIWAAIVGCAMISINSHRFSAQQRRFWLVVVIGVPLFGVLAYLPFAVRRADLPQVLLMKMQRDRWRKKEKASV